MFTQRVLKMVAQIPCGRVITYKDLAEAAGSPKAVRAVGNILHNNPHLIEIPCHRVVKSNGEVGGYVGGVKKKIQLLKKEGIKIKNGYVRIS